MISREEAENYMRLALAEARKAYEANEVPVGAVIVKEGRVIATGFNLRETRRDATAHAEMVALQKASAALGGWYLHDCTLIVTMEPCPMCTGAALQSRLAGIVFGAYNEKDGCCGSVVNLCEKGTFTHHIECMGGVLEEECALLLKSFFHRRRQEPDANRRIPNKKSPD